MGDLSTHSKILQSLIIGIPKKLSLKWRKPRIGIIWRLFRKHLFRVKGFRFRVKGLGLLDPIDMCGIIVFGARDTSFRPAFFFLQVQEHPRP